MAEFNLPNKEKAQEDDMTRVSKRMAEHRREDEARYIALKKSKDPSQEDRMFIASYEIGLIEEKMMEASRNRDMDKYWSFRQQKVALEGEMIDFVFGEEDLFD